MTVKEAIEKADRDEGLTVEEILSGKCKTRKPRLRKVWNTCEEIFGKI